MSISWPDPIHLRSPKGGEKNPINHHFYRGGEFETFFVPRPDMPQVDEAHFPELFLFAEKEGVLIEKVLVTPPEKLKPHQHIDVLKSKHMETSSEVMEKPIFISLDDYILDGNHRWLAHVLAKIGIYAHRFHLPFEQAIAFLFKFPHTYSYGDGAKHPISF